LLGQKHTEVEEQLRIIERQVCHAVRILDQAVAETRRSGAPRAKTAATA
jgi:hypothetical protein